MTLARQVAKDHARNQRKAKAKHRRELSREERHSLHAFRMDAHAHGVKLASGGRGGLSPSLVWRVMRRDEWQCKVCGENGSNSGGLTVHHIGGILESDWLAKKGHKNVPSDLVTICAQCHDRIHEKARAEGLDSSQVMSPADKDTKHDHGQPVYSPGQAEKQKSQNPSK